MRSLLSLPARRPRRGLGAIVVALLTLSTGCSFITGVPDVTRVEVSIQPPTIVEGGTATAIGVMYGKGGKVLTASSANKLSVSYESSDPSVATVSPTSGQIVGIKPGTATITASAHGKSGTAVVTVTQGPPARIDVTQPNLTLNGGRVNLVIKAYNISGQPIASRKDVIVTSSNPNVVTVQSDSTLTGVFLTPVTVGNSTIVVNIGGASVSLGISVLPAQPAKVQAALQKGTNTLMETETSQIAVALFAADNTSIPLTGQQIQYQSFDQTVAQVNAAGVVTGIKPGTAQIEVSVVGSPAKGTFTVTVILLPAKQVVIQNRNPFARLDANSTGVPTTRTAVVLDSIGRQISNRQVTYRSTDNSVFTVSGLGTVVPQKLGTAKLIASADNGAVADTISLQVTPVPIVSVKVNPATVPSIYPGQTQQFTATLTDSLGATVTGRPIQWQSSNPLVMSINQSTGLATAVAAGGGSATITAVVDQVPGFPTQLAGQASVLVLPTPIATIDVQPTTVSLKVGASTLVSIVPRDAAGNQLFGRTGNINVQSDNPGVAIGDNQGNVRGLTSGTAKITYQALDQSGNPQGAPTVITVTVQ